MVEVVRIGKAKPAQQVLEKLDELVAFAKSGELRSLIFIGECADRTTIHGATDIGDMIRVLGMLERLKYRAVASMDAGMTDFEVPTEADDDHSSPDAT